MASKIMFLFTRGSISRRIISLDITPISWLLQNAPGHREFNVTFSTLRRHWFDSCWVQHLVFRHFLAKEDHLNTFKLLISWFPLFTEKKAMAASGKLSELLPKLSEMPIVISIPVHGSLSFDTGSAEDRVLFNKLVKEKNTLSIWLTSHSITQHKRWSILSRNRK